MRCVYILMFLYMANNYRQLMLCELNMQKILT
jgi:hypothetical protein